MTLSSIGLTSPSGQAATPTQSPSAQGQITKTVSGRLDSLEVRIKKLEDDIDHATLRNEYIQQIQKQYETYYEKAFSTQLQILTILGIILSVLLFLAGRFGLSIFDRQVQLQLKSATDTLRSEFENRLAGQLKTLSEKNTAQLKELENGLKERIAILNDDLQLRSEFQFQFSMGTSAQLDKVFDSALSRFHRAMEIYVMGKGRGVVPLSDGATAVRFDFYAIHLQNASEFAGRAKKELENELYKSLGDELMIAAKNVPNLLPLLNK